MKINRVVLDQELKSREEAFEMVASLFLEAGIIEDKERYLAALNKRESEGTTGLVDGFAIPHGQDETVKTAGVVYIRNKNGIEWNSLDGSKITDIFGLAIPLEGGNHLDDLIAISSHLLEKEQCEKLRSLQDEDAIKVIFE